jgi:hypothetical protein
MATDIAFAVGNNVILPIYVVESTPAGDALSRATLSRKDAETKNVLSGPSVWASGAMGNYGCGAIIPEIISVPELPPRTPSLKVPVPAMAIFPPASSGEPRPVVSGKSIVESSS